jgi:hypothetical protein
LLPGPRWAGECGDRGQILPVREAIENRTARRYLTVYECFVV